MKFWMVVLISSLMASGAMAAEVPKDASEVQPLLPGTPAPSFTATNAYGETVRFDPTELERPAVLVFYRGGWCPYCNLYWSELRKIEDELLDLGVDLVFLSPDRPELLAEAVDAEEAQPRYQLLSDADTLIAQAFGIAFEVDDATVQRYLEYDIDLEKASGYKHHILPAPAVFIVATDGSIRFQYVNPDYTVRLHPDVLLAAARTMPEYRIKRP